MTLREMFDALTQRDAIPTSRAKDIKTSLRYLAQAFQATPETLTDAETLEVRYKTVIQNYFGSMTQPQSRYTVRNTLNNLSFFFRTARACNLLQAFIPQPALQKIDRALEREAVRTSPHYARTTGKAREKYCRPIDTWPLDIKEGWMRYQTARQFDLRATTIGLYQGWLMQYVGYRLSVEEPPITTWDQLFDPEALKRFIQWHAKRINMPRITASGKHVARIVIALAKHDARPELPALKALEKKLPIPEPIHDKQRPEYSLTLQELEQVGLTLLEEARQPVLNLKSHWPGAKRATRHEKGLILRLLVRIPLRQRNIRELQLGRNLYQDHHGVWQLQFQGEDLKVGRLRGRINTFQLPFPPDLVEHLEEFLQHYRPLLPHAAESQYLFLNCQGRPYTAPVLRHMLFLQVYVRTGKRFYPPLIRTIWTDAFLLKTHDISTAAYMLNDRPETVLQRYHELRGNDHIQKAQIFLNSLLGSS